jgi:hypothetical protein
LQQLLYPVSGAEVFEFSEMTTTHILQAAIAFGLVCAFFLPVLFAFRARDKLAMLATLLLCLAAGVTLVVGFLFTKPGFGALPALGALLWFAALVVAVLCDIRCQIVRLNEQAFQRSALSGAASNQLPPRHALSGPRQAKMQRPEPRF